MINRPSFACVCLSSATRERQMPTISVRRFLFVGEFSLARTALLLPSLFSLLSSLPEDIGRTLGLVVVARSSTERKKRVTVGVGPPDSENKSRVRRCPRRRGASPSHEHAGLPRSPPAGQPAGRGPSLHGGHFFFPERSLPGARRPAIQGRAPPRPAPAHAPGACCEEERRRRPGG